ncbi:MAG: helicase [Treponema sp.]|nr:helicase [Treponema sp.]
MDIHKYFTQSIITAMRRDIKEASGNEVCWIGTINADGRVISVKVGARGNDGMVLVNSALSNREVEDKSVDSPGSSHVVIHNHPSGVLEPSEADMNVASSYMEMGIGSYIVNNTVSDVYVIVEPVKPKILSVLDEDKIAGYLSSTGPLAKKDKNYEERPSQIELVKNVASAFNHGKIAAFEAGTGVGKSYAYLIPSMLWAINNKERIVISTGTINLQQQLVEKDIPAAQKIIGKKIKAILLKGRQNYLCLRRMNDALEEKDMFTEDADVLERIAEWSKTTDSGSRSDLSFMPQDSVWTRVNSESDACMGARCQYHDSCFVMRVRKEAADANVIVVNHHLLFADIESRMNGVGYDDTAVLPPYRRIVFDEAHGIEDSATSFFSETVNRLKLLKQINLLYRSYRGTMAGFLVQAFAVSSSDSFYEKADECINDIRDSVMALDNLALDAMENEFTSRLYNVTASRFRAVLKGMDDLRQSIGKFVSLARDVLDGISDEDSLIPCVFESKAVLRRLEDIVGLCKSFCEWEEHDDKVFWMQKVRLPPKKAGDDFLTYVQFVQTPLDVSPLMNMGVFEPMSSVVCTSATLRTGSSFNYWMGRTGLSFVEEGRLMEQTFDSPFPYRTNVLFAVPHDAPFPDNPMFQSYVEDTVPELILAAGGRTLVLFTSYDSLRNTYNSTYPRLLKEGIEVYRQGDDDRFRLLEKFKKNMESVLFATDSFWEGVDVPGESLSQVIIVKLPFAVPNDPVFQARSEAVEKRGGSPFMELSVPQAVIKFRQGFGRLIRRGDDRGVIVVLDRRIVEKQYGRLFTTSVPMSRRMYNPLADILAAIRKFF